MKRPARLEESVPVPKSKRKKLPAKSPPSASNRTGPTEDRTVAAVTVVWMLTLFCTLAAELVALACLALTRRQSPPDTTPTVPQLMTVALFFAALVTGVLCLALTPLVWRLRQIKPPLAIVATALVVGLAPLVTLVVLSCLT